MKTEIREVLAFPGEEPRPFKVPMLLYESVEEGDKAAGKAGAVLLEANNNLLYRGTYADARTLISDVVYEMTQVPWKEKDTGERDDKGQPIMEIDENEGAYVKRALGAKPVDFDKLQAEITRRASGYTYKDGEGKDVVVAPLAADITQRERKPKKPAVLPEKYKTTALGIIDKKNVDKFNKMSAKYGIAAFTPTGERDKDAVTFGWICKKYGEAVKAEADNAAAALGVK